MPPSPFATSRTFGLETRSRCCRAGLPAAALSPRPAVPSNLSPIPLTTSIQPGPVLDVLTPSFFGLETRSHWPHLPAPRRFASSARRSFKLILNNSHHINSTYKWAYPMDLP